MMNSWLLALSSLAASGCLGEPETEVGAASLVNGEPTNERPEVGLVWGDRWACTATLVDPRVVLTAAHCFDHRTGPMVGGFRTTSGAQYRIDRVESLGLEGPAEDDLALARLTTPVPAHVARPAPLATRRPSYGEPVTMFGYGCTDRANLAGSGTKRKFVFHEGFTVPRQSCAGDSGGPSFLMDGTITYVTSGYWNRSGNDIFGLVYAHRGWLTETIRDLSPSDRLEANQSLTAGQSISSTDGRFWLTYQTDGNLVLYQNGVGALWASNTSGTSAGAAIMQSDGNLVIYDAQGTPRWSSNTWGYSGAVLVLQTDGNLVLYGAGGALWASHTCCR